MTSNSIFWCSEEARNLLDKYIQLKVVSVPRRLQWLQGEVFKKTGINFHHSTLLRHARLRKIQLYGPPKPKAMKRTENSDFYEMNDNDGLPFPAGENITDFEMAKMEFASLMESVPKKDQKRFLRWIADTYSTQEEDVEEEETQFGSGGNSGKEREKGKPKYNLDEFLARHLNFTDDRLCYTPEEVLAVIAQAKEVIKHECTLVDVPLPVAIVGDIHGQYGDLHRIFAMVGIRQEGLPGSLCHRYLFLGDYIDRGTCSLEVICCLLVHKIYFPNMFFLIRGNHEHQSINRVYGFYEEVESRFDPPQSAQIYSAFNDLFDHLPLAALIAGRILCMHGGICSEVKSLDDIRKIKRPLHEPSVNDIACDLLWADPMLDLSGYVPNPMRGISVFFGEDALEKMCEQLKVEMVIRGHQVMQNGIGYYCGRKLVTIFSAPRYYPDKNNKGAVLTISREGRIGTLLLSPTSKLLQGDGRFRETFDKQEIETSYTERTYSAESMTLPDSEGVARCPSSITVAKSLASPTKTKSLKFPRTALGTVNERVSNRSVLETARETPIGRSGESLPKNTRSRGRERESKPSNVDDTQKETLHSCTSNE